MQPMDHLPHEDSVTNSKTAGLNQRVKGGARPRCGAFVSVETETAVKLKMRDLRGDTTMLGGTEIRVVEKYW